MAKLSDTKVSSLTLGGNIYGTGRSLRRWGVPQRDYITSTWSATATTLSSFTTNANPITSICWSPELALFCGIESINVGSVSETRAVIFSQPIASEASTAVATNVRMAQAAICWSPELGLFCASGYDEITNSTDPIGYIITSPDGVNWTHQNLPNTVHLGSDQPASLQDNKIRDIIWISELKIFCAVTSNGTNDISGDKFVAPRILTSPDGINWTARDISSPFGTANATVVNFKKVAWSPQLKLICAVGDRNTANGTITNPAPSSHGQIWTSPDGINWTDRQVDIDFIYSICWSPQLNLFTANGFDNSQGLNIYSEDGVTWNTQTDSSVTTTAPFRRTIWIPQLGFFYRVKNSAGTAGNTQQISFDGINWINNQTVNDTVYYRHYDVIWVPEIGRLVWVTGGSGFSSLSLLRSRTAWDSL